MKIALCTIGSRGDIQPYIALGASLQKAGHSISILTHPWAKELIQQYGIAHIKIGDDIDIHFAAKQVVANSSSNLKGFRFSLNFIFDQLRNCHQDLLNKLRSFDLVIGHGIVGEAEAELLAKPYIPISIAPMGLQKEYWESRKPISALFQWLIDKMLGAVFGKPYRRYRAEMGLPQIKTNIGKPYLALVPMPEFLQKHNPCWKKRTVVSGYLFADTPDTYVPPPALQQFLELGEKPILVSFGSMFHETEESKRLYKVICESIDGARTRAILIMPDLLEIENQIEIPKNLYLASQIPYSWLLDKVELVVHHFGFGTTAETLKAGLPAIPIPHIFDQNIRASNIYKLGYAHKPLNSGKLTSKVLSEAILSVKDNSGMKKKCQEARKEILAENGNGKAVAEIGAFMGKL